MVHRLIGVGQHSLDYQETYAHDKLRALKRAKTVGNNLCVIGVRQ